MKNLIVMVFVTLTFLMRVGEAKHNAYCEGNHCFAVFQDPVDFATAQKHCESNNGQLMTVRSSESQYIISILIGITGDYWIGLRLPSGQCPDSASDLRGYRWITGDNSTDFQNWGVIDNVCSSKCVSVSKIDLNWTEQSCDREIDGYLCEYNFPSVCKRIDIKSEESVLYETTFGFEGDDLLVLPMGSTATVNPFDSKYICLSEQWMQAPWTCDVLKGGCEDECLSINQQPVCICPPGKILHDNKFTCVVVQNDPCLHFGCAHVCYQKNDSSIACMCHHGYALAEDGKKCKDIDDCFDDSQCPGQNYECVNNIGGFKCRCQNGFKMMNDVCIDDDECYMDGPCEHICENTLGSYNCSCFEGYIATRKDPNKCQLHCPFEECLAECDPNDPHQCNCPEGYLIDVRNEIRFCMDINECDNGYCEHKCTNTYGGHMCSCYEEFDLVDGWKCVERELSEGSGFTTPSDFITPSVKYPTQRPSTVTAGGLIGIIVCIVIVVLVMIFLLQHILKRRSKLEGPSAPKTQGDDGHDLEQVRTEKYPKPSMDRNFKQNT
ncbi:thrombomodulin-like [Salvelinus fontinalis]|uniref:thrombomodulin-like n=1 Tax=Salvelinus fontinalis TaxID=8038 RepID=UPI002485BD5D|nr:thrombomodulin-like [Salvelinus fontinalis]